MAYWVEIIRREVNYERYAVCVEADSPEQAADRVREHYMGDGDVLTDDEESSECHEKHVDILESEVVGIGDVQEAA